jgi:uncharacterized protein (TIGR03435 family)
MRVRKSLLMMALVVCIQEVANAQPATIPSTFEVASVKRAAPLQSGAQTMGAMRATRSGILSEAPDRITYRNATLKAMLLRAYNLKPYQVSGPAWLDDERYDVDATLPDGAAKEQIPAMLQGLLLDRFQIVLHTEMKQDPVYVLAVGKSGAKLKPATEEHPNSAGGIDINHETGQLTFIYKAETMGALADMLSRLFERPIIDQTRLDGRFDFALLAESLNGGLAPDPASFFSAVRDVGLQLEPAKAPVRHLVVDKANKIPTEN